MPGIDLFRSNQVRSAPRGEMFEVLLLKCLAFVSGPCTNREASHSTYTIVSERPRMFSSYTKVCAVKVSDIYPGKLKLLGAQE